MDVRAGTIGTAYPSHRVVRMDCDGSLHAAVEQGKIVAHCNYLVHFFGYLQQPDAIAVK